ncbi:MAG TPA: hypothetical protein PLD20_07485 [Blastocatellia bacterium]|nr:hypothetical protein [Blastocatellia bacterium]HMZ17754.1 hypothetical protein [Blastocatellia bacterium]HNG33769.1 hypothetical protein [Blastocatellia bacterium]
MSKTTISLVVAFVIIGNSCHQVRSVKPDQVRQSQEINEQTLQIVELINSSPSWWDSYPNYVFSDAKLQELQACLKQIAKHDTQIIRDAVKAYYSQHSSQGSYNADEKGKLFLLNRYVFNVPNKSVNDIPSEVGWFYYGEENTDLLWPLSEVDKEGNIKLGLRHAVYTGQRYYPLEEFDFFNRRFGRREIKGASTK